MSPLNHFEMLKNLSNMHLPSHPALLSTSHVLLKYILLNLYLLFVCPNIVTKRAVHNFYVDAALANCVSRGLEAMTHHSSEPTNQPTICEGSQG